MNTKILGIEHEKWTHFIATFQLLLSILFVFQALPRLGLLPFSSLQVLEEIEDIKNGDTDLICAFILLLVNLVGGAMAMILEDGIREKNPLYMRKWVRFSIVALLLTISIDLMRFHSNVPFNINHAFGMGLFILIQAFCIFAVKFHELDLLEKIRTDDKSII